LKNGQIETLGNLKQLQESNNLASLNIKNEEINDDKNENEKSDFKEIEEVDQLVTKKVITDQMKQVEEVNIKIIEIFSTF